MDKFTLVDKYIFIERILREADIRLSYTSMIASNKSVFVFGGDKGGFLIPSAEVRRYDISDQKWHKMKEMPHYLLGTTAQIVDDKIFIMGGGSIWTATSYNLAYDINSDSWEEKAKIPIPRKGLVSGVINGTIYIACGYHMLSLYDVTPYCYAYNLKDDRWKQCQSPLINRAYAMSAVVDNFLYILGGYTDSNRSDGCITMERYCPESDLWEKMPDMPRVRKESVAVAIGLKIFVLCGRNGEENHITIDSYDTITREWTITNILKPVIESPGVAIIDNNIFTKKILEQIDIGVIYTSMVASNESIFVFGGDEGGFTPSAVVRRYDISNKKWHKMKEMPRYLWGSTAQIVGDKIFIMGGGSTWTYTSYNLAYDIKSDSWEEKASMPMSRKGLVSGVINGIIYVACGYHMFSAYDVTPYCYAYNPKDDSWKQCQRPLSNRSYAMSVVVDKFLYILGGYTEDYTSGGCRTMQRYCPKTDSWEEMPYMPKQRRESVAVAIGLKIFVLCGKNTKEYITMDYYDTITREWTITNILTPSIDSPGVAMIDNKIYLTGGTKEWERGRFNKDLYEITYGGIVE